VIPQRITADTLPSTCLPQRRPNPSDTLSQLAMLHLTSTADYDGSLKNDHYTGPTHRALAKLASRPKPVWTFSQSRFYSMYFSMYPATGVALGSKQLKVSRLNACIGRYRDPLAETVYGKRRLLQCRYPIRRGTPSAGAQNTRVEKICDFRL